MHFSDLYSHAVPAKTIPPKNRGPCIRRAVRVLMSTGNALGSNLSDIQR